MEALKIKNIFVDLDKTIAKELMEQYEYPWEVLKEIGDFILKVGPTLPKEEYEEIAEHVWVAKSASVAPTAYIGGPTIIGPNSKVSHCAYIRTNALVGAGCTVGNSTELKNVILFDGVEAPHYNYVGDAILGYKAHMGAGSITSNLKSDRKNVTVSIQGEKVETGIRKMGAILGDFAEIGCNSVLNPGTIIGHHSNVYPLSMVRGYVAPNSIYKKQGEVVEKQF